MSDGRERIWVSDDRCNMVMFWYDSLNDLIADRASSVTVAYREDPSHTWGPPITLTEEKT